MKLTVFALVLAVACARGPAPDGDTVSAAGSVSAATELVGPRWRLVELEGEPAIQGGAREPHLIFSRSDSVDRVGGATGCNSMGGSYEIEGSSIRFAQLFSTKMACIEEDRMRQEARFMKALESADRYAISGDTLELSAGTEVVARFVKD